jgi:hypothetical protein
LKHAAGFPAMEKYKVVQEKHALMLTQFFEAEQHKEA